MIYKLAIATSSQILRGGVIYSQNCEFISLNYEKKVTITLFYSVAQTVFHSNERQDAAVKKKSNKLLLKCCVKLFSHALMNSHGLLFYSDMRVDLKELLLIVDKLQYV